MRLSMQMFGAFALFRGYVRHSIARRQTVIAGKASVSNGDTLKFSKMRVRLWGVDSPEYGQKRGKTDAVQSIRTSLYGPALCRGSSRHRAM
jgi:endonuclease YncB( thermonuclease family)